MQPKGRQRMREAGDARRGFALPKAVYLEVQPPELMPTTKCSAAGATAVLS